MTKHIMIHGQHRISDVILRGLSSQPGVGSARWKSDLVDPHSLQYPVTKLLPIQNPSKWKTFNFERFESETLTVNNSWWLWNPKIPQFDQCSPAWGWPPKAFSTCRPASANFVRRFWPGGACGVMKRNEKPRDQFAIRILWEKRLNKLDTPQVGMDLPFLFN